MQVFEDNCSVISDDPPVVSPDLSDKENDLQKDLKLTLSRAPSIDEVANIDLDKDDNSEAKVNRETDRDKDIEERDEDIEEKEDTDDDIGERHLTSVVNNPDMRRESIAEIKRLAEEIVQKGDGRGPLCSVDSANINGNDFRSSIDEGPVVSHQQHTSVIVTNPSVDLAVGGSPASGNGTGR